MQVKLVKEVNNTPIDSIVEVDEVTGKSLVTEGNAIEYTDDVAKVEQKTAIKNELEVKKVNVVIKKELNMNDMIKKWKDDPEVIGKMFMHLAGKTITGNAEDSAANGAALINTGVAALQPLVLFGSRVYGKTTKIPISANANSMKIPVSIGDMWTKTSPITFDNPAEGVAFSTSKGQLEAQTLTLTKVGQTVAITDELMEDAAGVDAWIRTELTGKLANVLDYEILKGGGSGFVAINGATNYCITTALSATPTLAEYVKLVNLIHPSLQDGAEFYMSITDWNLAVGTFGTAANLMNQLIDISGKRILGIPVNVMPFLAAGDVVLGNLSKYCIIETPQKLQVSTEVRFLEGETVFKLSQRSAGAPIYKKHATGDSLSVAAFSEKS